MVFRYTENELANQSRVLEIFDREDASGQAC